jgi:hypothetical protein
MAPNLTNQDWRSLAEQASTEMDSAKLTSLVAELCRSLDERQQTPLSFSAKNSRPCESARQPVETRKQALRL